MELIDSKLSISTCAGIERMIFRFMPICILFFVLCPIAVSQGITSEQWIKMGEEFIQIDSYKGSSLFSMGKA
jgi:hypothetical protein